MYQLITIFAIVIILTSLAFIYSGVLSELKSRKKDKNKDTE